LRLPQSERLQQQERFDIDQAAGIRHAGKLDERHFDRRRLFGVVRPTAIARSVCRYAAK
jgi:hypothetical protein